MLGRAISKAGEPVAFKNWWGQVYVTEYITRITNSSLIKKIPESSRSSTELPDYN